MHFFEEELKKMMGGSDILKDQKYLGRNCYGTIGDELRARVEIVTNRTRDQYEAVKISVIKRTEGVVDSIVIPFTDVWGYPKTPSFPEGRAPYIWSYDQSSSWYAFKPQSADYRKLAQSMENYLSVFRDMDMAPARQDNGMQMKS